MAVNYYQAGHQAGSGVKSRTSSASFTGAKPSAMLYLGLASIAFLKDLLDFTGIGSLPGLGTVVTICFAFLIWMLMTLFDRSGGKQNNKIARSVVLFLASLVEAIGFGLNFLPIETLTVIALYTMARSAWKKQEKSLAAEQQKQVQAEQARQYQMAQIARAAEEAANDAEYQKEAANDEAYSTEPIRKVV